MRSLPDPDLLFPCSKLCVKKVYLDQRAPRQLASLDISCGRCFGCNVVTFPGVLKVSRSVFERITGMVPDRFKPLNQS